VGNLLAIHRSPLPAANTENGAHEVTRPAEIRRRFAAITRWGYPFLRDATFCGQCVLPEI